MRLLLPKLNSYAAMTQGIGGATFHAASFVAIGSSVATTMQRHCVIAKRLVHRLLRLRAQLSRQPRHRNPGAPARPGVP